MTEFFDTLKAKAQELIRAKKALTDVFEISTSEIKLKKPQSLNELAHLFSSLFGDDHGMPDLPFGEATLKKFSALKGDPKIHLATQVEIGLDFKSAAKWDAAPGLSLSLTSARIRYFGGDWTGNVTGRVTFKNLPFEISLDWPSLGIEGRIVDVESVDLKELTGLMALEHEGGNASLETLNILAVPRAHHYTLEVEASNLVRVGPVALKSASVQLDYQGGENAGFTGSLQSEIEVGAFNLQVEAEKTDAEWTAKAQAKGKGTLRQAVGGITGALFNKIDITDHGVPAEIADRELSGDVVLSFASEKKHVTLKLTVEVSDKKGAVHFSLDLSKSSGVTVKADLELSGMHFEVDFAKKDNTKVLAAHFRSEDGLTVSVSELAKLSRLGDNGDGNDGDPIPDIGANLEMTLRDVLVAMASDGSTKKYLLAADVDGGIDLTGLGDLPLVGAMMPRDTSMRLSLAPVLVNSDWGKDRALLANLVGDEGPDIPDPLKSSKLGVSIKLPGEKESKDLGIELGDTSGNDKDIKIKAKDNADASVSWKTIDKSLGPVSIQRIGMGLDNSKKSDPRLKVLMDASLGLGPLEMSMLGLGGSYGLKSKKMDFSLSGMGLDFQRPPLEIGGAFALIDTPKFGKQYLGKAKVQMKTIGLAASGGFGMIGKTPSMFIYGVLNTPLGGPPFFFVEGLAAGFGFNRDFIAPPLKEIHSFPFVKDAIGAAAGNSHKPDDGSIVQDLNRLAAYVQPRLGQYFLAAGVKFTSFKLLDSFVLLVLSAGRELKIDVLGTSTFQTPPLPSKNLPAMAKIILDLKASLRPNEGSLLVQANLAKGSYVYSPVVKLEGGFAFASWFGGPHAGDFVISAGGYHPKFKKPSHYPDVDRISLTFKIPHVNMTLKGSAYFALTPSMLMAGGSLHADGKFGKVSASFKLDLDFQVMWEPYHYEMDIRISVSARWWKFSTHASAQLSVWGPEFGGFARVTWTIIDFDVDFGAGKLPPPPIKWAKFQESFLPHDKAKAVKVDPTVSIAAGEMSVTADDVHVVNPETMQIVVDSILPADTLNKESSQTWLNRTTPNGKPVPQLPALGCAPVGIKALDTASLDLVPSKHADRFVVTPIFKEFPAAMWAESPLDPPSVLDNNSLFAGLRKHPKPKLNAPATVKAIGGAIITIKKASQPEGEARHKLKPTDYKNHVMAPTVPTPSKMALGIADKGGKNAILKPTKTAAARRTAILQQLGVDPGRAEVRSSYFEGPDTIALAKKKAGRG